MRAAKGVVTTKPSGVLNNWGYSKLARGEFKDAERLFKKLEQGGKDLADPALIGLKEPLGPIPADPQ